VVRFYNKGGTAEQWIKEGKQAVKLTRLSCHRFRSNDGPAVAKPDRLQPRQPRRLFAGMLRKIGALPSPAG
jgi:hypothetical protein